MVKKSYGNVILYKTPDGDTQIDVKLEDETVWLNLNQLSALLQKDKSVISRNVRNIFKEKELQRNSTVAKFATIQLVGNSDKFIYKNYINY